MKHLVLVGMIVGIATPAFAQYDASVAASTQNAGWINPGGPNKPVGGPVPVSPILISCIIGKGCTTTHLPPTVPPFPPHRP